MLPLGIDEEQKSLKTIEDVMVFFAEVGLMRRETPLLSGGGLITDIVGTACALYRRSTSYVRLPTTLIGMIDASVAIKVRVRLCPVEERSTSEEAWDTPYLTSQIILRSFESKKTCARSYCCRLAATWPRPTRTVSGRSTRTMA